MNSVMVFLILAASMGQIDPDTSSRSSRASSQLDDTPVLPQPVELPSTTVQRADPTPSQFGKRKDRSADSIIGNGLSRIDSRIQNRVQSRIMMRIDRDYTLQLDTGSSIKQAEDRATSRRK